MILILRFASLNPLPLKKAHEVLFIPHFPCCKSLPLFWILRLPIASTRKGTHSLSAQKLCVQLRRRKWVCSGEREMGQRRRFKQPSWEFFFFFFSQERRHKTNKRMHNTTQYLLILCADVAQATGLKDVFHFFSRIFLKCDFFFLLSFKVHQLVFKLTFRGTMGQFSSSVWLSTA